MHAINGLWSRQLVEGMKEVSVFYQHFKEAIEPEIEDLDRAMELYNSCHAYQLKQITFEEFIEFGTSLRARQALTNSQKGL